MEKYELTIVLSGKSKPAKKTSVQEKIEKLIKTAGGRVEKTDDWGEIELAYKIKKETSGVFVHFLLELGNQEAKSLPGKLSLESDVIRYLLVRSKKE